MDPPVLLETEEKTDLLDPLVQLDLQDHRVHVVRAVSQVSNHNHFCSNNQHKK